MAQAPKDKAAETAAAAEAEAVDQKQEESSEDSPLKYHRDRLVAESHAFFGVAPHVMAGALRLAKTGAKTNFTRDEGQAMIDQFLDHEVEMTGKGA